MNILAIDIGGTKFSLALFDGDPLIQRESRPTHRDGGPEWMLAEIEKIVRVWPPIDRCGIGFGGPVDFARQRVTLSTHVAGWQDFPLVERITEILAGLHATKKTVINVVIDN